ncbi:MAG: hypothetical protein KDB32_12660, partial [Planctomycetes bacterium]|nr:hypothetical protein [Planctomycetota bacterium]
MDYRKHRPWILSFAAIAFVIVAFWYARPVEAPSHKQPTNTPAPKTNNDNTPPTISPAPGNDDVGSVKQPGPSDHVEAESLDSQEIPEAADKPKYSDLSNENLVGRINAGIDESDYGLVRSAFTELQGRGDDGIVQALALCQVFIEKYGYGELVEGSDFSS